MRDFRYPSNIKSWIVFYFTVSAVTGCSLLYKIEDECNSDADCADIGSYLECQHNLCVDMKVDSDTGEDAPDTGPWRCVGDTLNEQALKSSAEKASVRVQACNFITNCADGVTNLTAKLCNKLDVDCQNPLETNITDEDGELQFEVSTGSGGFDGYLYIMPQMALCTDEEVFGESGPELCAITDGCDPLAPDEHCMLPIFAPAMLFFNPRIVADVDIPYTVPLLPSSALLSVVEAAGAKLDPSTGNVFITAIDCDGQPAAGVHYELSEMQEDISALYVSAGVVTNAVSVTGESGVGGFVGIRPGFASVIGYTEDGRRIGEIGFQTAPFTLTYSTLIGAGSP